MNREDEQIAREMREAVEALPADDPLRQMAGLTSSDADDFRHELLDVEIPDFEDRLLAIPDQAGASGGGAVRWAVAAAVVLAFGAGALSLGLWERFGTQEEALAEAPELDEPRHQTAPRLIAVKWWHRTCPACKELDPRYVAVVDKYSVDDVLFVTLDMSTEESRRQSEMMAETLGIGEEYREYFGSSGFVVLFDAQTKEIRGRITSDLSTPKMRGRLDDALAASVEPRSEGAI